MAISIPDTVFDTYYDVCDWLLSNNYTSYVCTLVYPPTREVCTSCVVPNNAYAHGGPAPFTMGLCPACGGNGYKEVITTGSIRLRVYWARKDWLKIAGSINIQDATAQIIGNISDMPNLLKASEIIVVDQQSQTEWKMTLACEPFLHGFGKDKYFVAYLKRV